MSGSPDHRIVSHINFKSIRIAIIVTKIYLHIHLHVNNIQLLYSQKATTLFLLQNHNTARQQLFLCATRE